MPMIFRGVNEEDNPMDLVASHQRILLGACLRTKGRILELGCGAYSTPLLHEIAQIQEREVLTADNNADWLNQYKGMESPHHVIQLVGWWGDFYRQVTRANRWSVALVDHGQPIEREYAIRALLDYVDVFVLHDTEEAFAYGYGRTIPLFKYVWTDTWQRAHTSVASNKIDVTGWFKPLPPVETTAEVS